MTKRSIRSLALTLYPLFALAVSSCTGEISPGTGDVWESSVSSPWSDKDIGAVGVPGTAGHLAAFNLFGIKASGADIWNAADAFHFIYRPMTGDGSITANVVELAAVSASLNPWAKAGVMIRETLDPGSKHAMTVVTGSSGVAFQWRPTTSGQSNALMGSTSHAPHFVRIDRTGATLSSYESNDGVSWNLIGTSSFGMASTVYVGMVVTSHNVPTVARALFDHVTTSFVSEPQSDMAVATQPDMTVPPQRDMAVPPQHDMANGASPDAGSPSHFFACIDTMKESMDTDQNNQLSASTIASDVNLSASLNTTHITINTYYDYPDYMLRWINAVRATGKHVWFRNHFCNWDGKGCANATGTMTPAEYLTQLQAFVSAHPSFYQAGDIFDPNPEPEDSNYWVNAYGMNWSWQNAPNAATDAFNNFLVQVSQTAQSALNAQGVYGVITGVRSVNEWFLENPTALYNSTLNTLGYMAMDNYADQDTTDPATAVSLRMAVINQVIQTHPTIPLILAEFGYSNTINVDDTTQKNVIDAELAAIAKVPNIVGVNYWVGACNGDCGGYTHIFAGSTGAWTPRPAALSLSHYFQSRP